MILLFLIMITSLFFIFYLLANHRQYYKKPKREFIINDDSSITGKINPFFCYGNPFYSAADKASNATFKKNPNKIYKVLGIGDKNGPGWQGGDSVGSIELSNGDLIFVFGDSFITKMQQPNVWLSFRDYTLQMPHNSISYMKLKDGKIHQNIFFIGQNKDNLINNIGFEYNTDCHFTFYNLQNYKKNPLDFTHNGCNTLLQPSGIKSTSKNISCWLYGGMNDKNNIAILAGNFIGFQNVGFQFIEIKDAIHKTSLNINPYLWDKIGIRHELPSVPKILWTKINKFEDNYIIYGGKNLHPGTDIYLLKGTYSEFLNKSFFIWNGNKWCKFKDFHEQKPLIVKDFRNIGPNYFSEFEKYDNEYFFYSIGIDSNNKYVLFRYISKYLTGPYSIDTEFTYKFPNWINSRSDQLDCYCLRSHPRLAKCLNVKSVLSYICQGRFPQYSGYIFDPVLSSYNIYYPQFILIDF